MAFRCEKKENSVKKRPKKIIISLAAINSYVMLSLKYVMQELSLNDIYVSHWSFGKCKIRIMRPVLKFGTFFFSPKILSPKTLKLEKFALVLPGPYLTSIYANFLENSLSLKRGAYFSPRGRRSKGKGKGIRVRNLARGRRNEGNAFLSFLPRAPKLPRRLGLFEWEGFTENLR